MLVIMFNAIVGNTTEGEDMNEYGCTSVTFRGLLDNILSPEKEGIVLT